MTSFFWICNLLATGHLELIIWRIKRDRALHETGAILTPSDLGLRRLADNWCRAERSLSGSAALGLSRDSTSDGGKTTLFSPRLRGESNSWTRDRWASLSWSSLRLSKRNRPDFWVETGLAPSFWTRQKT